MMNIKKVAFVGFFVCLLSIVGQLFAAAQPKQSKELMIPVFHMWLIEQKLAAELNQQTEPQLKELYREYKENVVKEHQRAQAQQRAQLKKSCLVCTFDNDPASRACTMCSAVLADIKEEEEAKEVMAQKPAVFNQQYASLPARMTFSIASNNVLQEHLYDKFFNQQVNKKQFIMPLGKRQQLFKDAFEDPNQLAGKDFIMVQEHANKNRPKELHTPHGVPYYSIREVVAAHPKKFGPITKNRGRFIGTADLYYNYHKFELAMPIIDQQSGRYAGGVYRLKGYEPLAIGVISTHIGFPSEYSPDPVGTQLKPLLGAINAVENSILTVNNKLVMEGKEPQLYLVGWVVGGDFNMDGNAKPLAKHTKQGLAEMQNAGFYDTGIGRLSDGRFLTGLGKEETPKGSGNYISDIQGIDYIFYKGNVAPIRGSLSVYPAFDRRADQHNRDLLTSGHPWPDGTQPRDNDRCFYSDHSIIQAQFGAPQ